MGTMARFVAPKAIPVVQKMVGLPTEHELICKALNSSKLENRTQAIACGIVLNDLTPGVAANMCQQVLSFAWKQEGAQQDCPGAPKAWEPFRIISKIGHKFMCAELKEGRLVNKEHEISREACADLSDDDMSQLACQLAIEGVLGQYKQQCGDHPIVDVVSDLIEE